MLGYVTVEKPELKIREFEIYSGYYCGVCKSIGRRYGQLPRMVLSYDAAFLAMVFAGVEGEEESITREHCIVHPVKKKTVISNKATDFAADLMLILAWHKLRDDVEDEGKITAKIACAAFKNIYRRLETIHPEIAKTVESNLAYLTRLEKDKSPVLDKVSHSFAVIMEDIFKYTYDPGNKESEEHKLLMGRLGYHLGKWIYLMDGWEDLEENLRSGAYNPVLYRYKFDGKSETVEEFRDRVRPEIERNLLIYLSEMSKAIDLLDIIKNRSIIENVVYLGLLRRTEKAIGKDIEHGKSL